MNDDHPIIFGSDGWYDALTGERLTPSQINRLRTDSKHNAAMVGIGPNKTWEQAHDDAVKAVYALTQKLEAVKQNAIDIVKRHLKEVTDDQDTVRRMNKIRIGDKSHEKYQREIDRLTSILSEIEQLDA